jgi:hypothetical protein
VPGSPLPGYVNLWIYYAGAMISVPITTIATAILRNQSKRFGITKAVKLVLGKTERGGVKWSEKPVAENLVYAEAIFCTLSPWIGDARNRVGLEIGPGDSLGVAYHFLANGASRIFTVEKHLSIDVELNDAILKPMPSVDRYEAVNLTEVRIHGPNGHH